MPRPPPGYYAVPPLQAAAADDPDGGDHDSASGQKIKDGEEPGGVPAWQEVAVAYRCQRGDAEIKAFDPAPGLEGMIEESAAGEEDDDGGNGYR